MSEAEDTTAEGKDTIRYPICAVTFRHQGDLTQGTHVAYQCSCGQLLQWDDPVTSLAPSLLCIGPPQPCQHPDLLKPDARVPLP